MTRAEKEDLRAVLEMLGRVEERMDTIAADMRLITEAIRSHRDRLGRLEACLDCDTPVDPAA